MLNLSLNIDNTKPFVSDEELNGLQGEIGRLHEVLEKGQGLGHDYLGWLHLPSHIEEAEIAAIEETASAIRAQCDAFVVIGIGGSYLGARAAINFCQPLLGEKKGSSEIFYAGHNISGDYLSDLLDALRGKRVCLNVISKSGTTTEPAIAFRILKEALEKDVGVEEARKRIVATTDEKKGALKQLADAEGYKTFVIPDDVGGRYSVLTPVGLLPIAVAGIDVRRLLQGARDEEAQTTASPDLKHNTAYRYAAVRHLLYLQGKTTEVMASFHPSLQYVVEWWKQLTGESEGKNHRGLFPASVEYTTDLHSMGQWMQEGQRTIFETFLRVGHSNRDLQIPQSEDDRDGLNYLAGRNLDHVNEKAYEGTAQAHLAGGVPNMTLTLKNRDPETLGQLFYFFERAIALSGYLLHVNPFDQPGVEFYKKNMFQLLNKPGYEKR
ncbi:glucose-6-phosphate isomerase [Nitrospina gracilis]|uniref:glucose-6-phosphate isomerase n=1 Tax=Nitrospina gracilis TaxID=35801 RepID=UPI001F00280C|nr:glucose-6-phosphate isomerase [Nitrospina gracilis]MCF8720404.1 glucose-6-phosphate isomerase [Nitrospina gracilis Nb-211]